MQPALEWATQQQGQLSPDGSPSTFEFKLQALNFVNLLKEQGRFWVAWVDAGLMLFACGSYKHDTHTKSPLSGHPVQVCGGSKAINRATAAVVCVQAVAPLWRTPSSTFSATRGASCARSSG